MAEEEEVVEGESGNIRRDGGRRGAEGGEREKDARSEPRGGEGRRTELSLLKVVPGRWERERSKGVAAGWTT